jgi:hypothetical protein
MMVKPATPHWDDMDDATFLRHYNLRHVKQDLQRKAVHGDELYNIQVLRAFHELKHKKQDTRHTYDHTHKERT